MEYKRTCLNCGKEFTTTCNGCVNCSIKCKGEYQFKNTIKRIENENNIEDLKIWLEKKYSKEMQTFRWIAKTLSINNRTVPKLLKHFNITIRHGSEAVKAQWATEEKRNIRRKPNEYVLKEDHAEIKIYRKTKDKYDTVLIDLEDVEKCKKHHWTVSQGYVNYAYIENKKRFNVKLYRYLLNVPDGKLVDHINGKPLDNRKSNLRICTYLENAWNKIKSNSSRTEFKGISKRKNGKYQVGIGYKGKKIYIGTFANKQDAIKARKEAELKYFGEYSYLNRNKVINPKAAE